MRTPAARTRPFAGGDCWTDDHSISPAIRSRLLRWFDQHQRDLPWRHDRDPYRIWVSEIMLQQTQVATVIGYFERFINQFPDLTTLAAATEQEVLRHWEGLGYYRRARHLHRAAGVIVRHHAGQFPEDPDIVRNLPGIGRYTLGAILSQAFDQRLPILEANSRRVLCRLFGRTDDPRRGSALQWLWKTATDLLPARRVGDFNQAVMELGALVCTPQSPRCADCPLAKPCVARRLGIQEQIPVRVMPPKEVTVREVCTVVQRGAKVLLVQRPNEGRWAGMWEFPRTVVGKRQSAQEGALRFLESTTRLRTAIIAKLATIRHAVTHHRITLTCFTADYRGGRFSSVYYPQGKWVALKELLSYPMSVPQRKLTRLLLARRK